MWNDDVARKGELALAVGQYRQAVDTLTERSQEVEDRLPPPALARLRSQRPALFVQHQVTVSPAAQREVQRALDREPQQ